MWKEYAYAKRIHPAITTYLDIKKSDFYKIETTVDGKSFVTARGWSDLSDMMKLYEQHGITIDEKLIGQYLQNRKIAKEFAIYYDLFNKYRSDYQVDKVLAGNAPAEIKDRAKVAKFDERLALLGLLLDGITEKLRAVCLTEKGITELLGALKNVKLELTRPGADGETALQKQITALQKRIETGKLSSTLSQDDTYALHSAVAAIEGMLPILKEKQPADGAAAFKLIKEAFDGHTKALKKQAEAAGKELSNVFTFCEEVFGDGQEMLILVTELTISHYGAHFISRYGCREYFNHNKELLFYERQKEIIMELEKLDLED